MIRSVSWSSGRVRPAASPNRLTATSSGGCAARFDQRFVEASELFDLVRLQVVVRPCLADPRPEIEPQYPSSSERLEFVPGQHRGLGRD
jgi:hypothetical protein